MKDTQKKTRRHHTVETREKMKASQQKRRVREGCPSQESRDHRLSVAISRQQWELIQDSAKAAHCSVSCFVRCMIESMF